MNPLKFPRKTLQLVRANKKAIVGGLAIPKLAIGGSSNAGNAGPQKISLNIPQLQIPSLNIAGKDQNKKDPFSTPHIASTPMNELLNVLVLLL